MWTKLLFTQRRLHLEIVSLDLVFVWFKNGLLCSCGNNINLLMLISVWLWFKSFRYKDTHVRAMLSLFLSKILTCALVKTPIRNVVIGISLGQKGWNKFTAYVVFGSHLLALVGGDLSQMDQVNFVCHKHHGECLPESKRTHTHKVRYPFITTWNHFRSNCRVSHGLKPMLIYLHF